MRFILLIINFLFILTVHGQYYSVSGKIVSAATGKAICNANILLNASNKGVISDSAGYFLITGLKQGYYTLKISHLGYEVKEKKIHVSLKTPIIYTIELDENVFTTALYEVKAGRENVLEKPSRINIISAKEISNNPAQSIDAVLDYTTGVNLNNTTGIFSSKSIVSMRGLPSNEQSRVLVILDGIPLNKADEGSVNWNMVNKNNIETIRVIKGPGPAKYGSGAMGGVIEMVSKKPIKKIEGGALLSYGSFNTILSDISVSGVRKIDSVKTFYWKADAVLRKSDGYITTPDVYQTIEDTILVPTYFTEVNTTIKGGYILPNNQKIEIQSSFFDDKRGNGVKVFDNFGAYSKHRTFRTIANYSGSNEYFRWQGIAYNTTEFYNRIYEYMNEGEYKLYEADSKRGDKGITGELLFIKIEKHKIETGFNIKQGLVDGTDTYYTSTDIIRNTGKMASYAFFIQDEIKFSDKFLINSGIRYDRATFYDALFSISYPSYSVIFYQNFETKELDAKSWHAISPRLSAQYAFTPYRRLYLSASRGFRAPVLDDLSRTGRRKGSFSVANPNLNPELLTSLEFGGDFDFSSNLQFGASVYYSIGKDFMYYTSTGDSVNMGYKLAPIFRKENIGKVEISGIETELKYDTELKFSAFINYAYNYAIIAEHNINDIKVDSNLTGKYLTNLPKHKFSCGISYLHSIINTSLLFKYYGSTWINEWNIAENEYFKTDKFPSYYILNLRLDRSVQKHLSVALNIENLLDKVYVDGSLQQCPGRMVFFSIRGQF